MRRVFTVVCLVLAGCPSKSTDGASPAASSAAPVATASATTAALSASAARVPLPVASRPAPPRVKPPRSFEQLAAELSKKCPAKLDGNNLEMKGELEKAGVCIKRKMISDLDAVLVPLKTTNEPRFRALMKEQADWNRFIESACFIEEERQWVDFATGERSDGTMRSLAYLGCISSAMTERELYARSLAAGSTAALAKRIDEKQSDGGAVKKVVAGIATKSAAFAKTPPSKSPDTFSEADWPRIVTESEAMQKRTLSLAKETCAGWPDLAKALGGTEACEAKAESYYYAQGNAPDVALGPESH